MTRGVRQIVRLNWPFYFVAAAAVIVALLVTGHVPQGSPARAMLYAALPLAAYVSSVFAAALWTTLG